VVRDVDRFEIRKAGLPDAGIRLIEEHLVAEAVNALAPAVEQSSEDRSIVTIGDELICVRRKDEHWDRKTQRQARQLYALMDRFLVEERDIHGIAAAAAAFLA
jgi:hypothetical protein